MNQRLSEPLFCLMIVILKKVVEDILNFCLSKRCQAIAAVSLR